MTNDFTKQKLSELFLKRGRTLFKSAAEAAEYKAMLISQVNALIAVYKDLNDGWLSYTENQINEKGPWKACCIYTQRTVKLHAFSEAQQANFWVYYDLEQNWSETLKIQPVANNAGRGVANEFYELNSGIHPILLDVWAGLFYNHNYVSPSLFNKLYLKKLIETFSSL